MYRSCYCLLLFCLAAKLSSSPPDTFCIGHPHSLPLHSFASVTHTHSFRQSQPGDSLSPVVEESNTNSRSSDSYHSELPFSLPLLNFSLFSSIYCCLLVCFPFALLQALLIASFLIFLLFFYFSFLFRFLQLLVLSTHYFSFNVLLTETEN